MLAIQTVSESGYPRTPAGSIPQDDLAPTGKAIGQWIETRITPRMSLRLGRYQLLKRLRQDPVQEGRWFALNTELGQISALAYLNERQKALTEDLLPAALLAGKSLPDLLDVSELIIMPATYVREFPEHDLHPLIRDIGLTPLGQICCMKPFPEIEILVGRN